MATDQTKQIVVIRIQVGVTAFQAAVVTGGLTGTLLQDMIQQCEQLVLAVDEDTVYDLVKQLYDKAKGNGQVASIVA